MIDVVLELFWFQGPNCTISMDGHDKLCGFQKNTYPLCIYGAQDCWSGKMLFLKVWSSNNKPGIVARYYYEYLEESCSKSFYFTFTYTFFKAEFSDFSGIKLVYSEIRLGISSEWKELFWTLPPITNSL